MMDAISSSPVDFHDGARVAETEGIGNCEFDPRCTADATPATNTSSATVAV
jgi:hypothetical protein